MPGVPSGRGCDACRKQKKKCDGDSQELPCSRCKRLEIPCVGFGKQRYKFKDESQRFQTARDHDTVTKPRQRPLLVQLPRNPSNSMTKLSSAFIHKIDPSTSINYHLMWNFGVYLLEIPSRLGTSPALDAASDALVTAHTIYCSGSFLSPGRDALGKYSNALNALRDSLSDPIVAYSSETLCAIMVLSIVQMLIAPAETLMISHTEGAARILKCRGLSGPRTAFERMLILTLRGQVFEALVNDKIQFSQPEWKSLVEDGLEDLGGDNSDVEWLNYLARVPNLMHRCRSALHGSSMLLETSLLDLIYEVNLLLERCRLNITMLRNRLRAFEDGDKPPPACALKNTAFNHSYRLRVLSQSLMTGSILSCILSSLMALPLDLFPEIAQWSAEIVLLAERSVKYHPLASMTMIYPLYIAWIGAASESLRGTIEALILDYEKECLGFTSSTGPMWSLQWVERRFLLKERLQPGVLNDRRVALRLKSPRSEISNHTPMNTDSYNSPLEAFPRPPTLNTRVSNQPTTTN